MQRIIYKTDNLGFRDRQSLIKKAYKYRSHFYVDILDCSRSFARQRIAMSFSEVFDKVTKEGFFRIALDRYVVSYDVEKYGNYSGVVFYSSASDPEYFIWIHLSPRHLFKLLNEFNIRKSF